MAYREKIPSKIPGFLPFGAQWRAYRNDGLADSRSAISPYTIVSAFEPCPYARL